MISLYVGGQAGTIQGEREDLTGLRMFTAAHSPQRVLFNPVAVTGLLDSGAFTDPPERRLSPEAALARQLAWEIKASEKWGQDWQAAGLVSYDFLIDETWTAGKREKRRWTVKLAEAAVRETVAAAEYLANQRQELAPRRLILSAQGVDALQYAECATSVLQVARSGDVFGLGGWCILGQHTTLLPEFWATLYLVLPMVARAGLKDVHIFGVLYRPALGGLLWLADQYNLNVSTDSSAPILACTWKNKGKAGVRADYWKDNVAWWRGALASLRQSDYYHKPPDIPAVRQMTMFW